MRFKDLEYATQVILKIVLVVLSLGFLWVIREIIALFLLAVVLASALDPLADYLHKHRVPRWLSVMAVYIVVLGGVGLAVYAVIPALLEQIRLLSLNLPDYLASLQTRYPGFAGFFGELSAGRVFEGLLSGGDATVVGRTVGAFSGALGFVTVLVVSFYLVVADQKGMKELLRPLVPASSRDMVMGIVQKIQRKMGLWVLGQLILSVAIFILTYLGLSLLDIKYALVLAILAGLFEVVPYIGPILSALPSFFFALVQSPVLAVAVIALYIFIQKIESYILVPKIMQKTVGTSPLVVLLSLLIGFKLAGIVGLILAVPVASAIMVVIEELSGESNVASIQDMNGGERDI